MEHDPNTVHHMRDDHGRHHHAPAGSDASHKVKDPVCGMTVDPQTAKHRAEAAGATYYFCSPKCREKFVAEPARYLKAEVAAPAAKPAPAGRSTPARCIRKSGRSGRAIARSAAWRWNRRR